MRLILKVVKYILAIFLSLVILATAGVVYLYYTADRTLPEVRVPDTIGFGTRRVCSI